MEIFLVGGAVRDELLDLPITDRDWVVVGSNPQAMLDAGFKSVGKDFPVFLHPETREEYALARLERKIGPGYHGFAFDTDSSVTLEEDLSRRDLTINAMARDANGKLIDPWNGKGDLDNRLLRHVSDAFVEDPLRVLRVARFKARLAKHGFTVAQETQALMRNMAASGELSSLVAERVWQEMQNAMASETPRAFFETLRECNALQAVLPELDALAGVPQKKQWHPEIDTFLHTMMVLDQASRNSMDAAVRFAAVCHDLGKATTPKEILPSHHGHEERGAKISEAICHRLRVPKKMQELATLTARFHTHCHRAMELNADTLTKTLKALDVKRRPERFSQFLSVCEADARGRLGFEHTDYPQSEYLAQAAEALCSVNAADIARKAPSKTLIADEIYRAELLAIKNWVQTLSQ